MGPHAQEPTGQTSYEDALTPRPNRTGAVFWKTSSGELSETSAPGRWRLPHEASCKGARQLGRLRMRTRLSCLGGGLLGLLGQRAKKMGAAFLEDFVGKLSETPFLETSSVNCPKPAPGRWRLPHGASCKGARQLGRLRMKDTSCLEGGLFSLLAPNPNKAGVLEVA